MLVPSLTSLLCCLGPMRVFAKSEYTFIEKSWSAIFCVTLVAFQSANTSQYPDESHLCDDPYVTAHKAQDNTHMEIYCDKVRPHKETIDMRKEINKHNLAGTGSSVIVLPSVRQGYPRCFQLITPYCTSP